MSKSIKLRKADDMHVHLRQGEILSDILAQTITQVSRAIVMPNTSPSINNAADLKKYRQNIEEALKRINEKSGKHTDFKPLMTFKILPDTTIAMVKELKAAGAVAGKLYPEGVTTNSEHGIKDFKSLYPIYEAMAQENLILCVHGEEPSAFCLDREEAFLPMLKQIAQDFPKLKIVLEHLTTAKAVKLVQELSDNVAATITVHHLLITLDDVIGGHLKPHLFCKPLAKREHDRKTLIEAAVGGNPKFFLGSDSAPHLSEKKECDCGAAGVYTAPVLLPVLAQIFTDHNKLDKLESFISEYGAKFYGLPLNDGKIELVEKSWIVPAKVHGVVPFMAGQKLNWQVLQSKV